MNFDEAFPSKYLKASDLKGGSITATISGFTKDEEGKIQKPIILFQNATKGWVLNKTNGLTIQAAYGNDMDLWIGQPVELYSAMVPFEGKNVAAIRCRIPTHQTLPPVAVPVPNPLTEPVPVKVENATDLSDDIPF